MITLQEIDKSLIIAGAEELKDNLVAIAMQTSSGGFPYHSGLIIAVNGDYFLFHYDAKDVIMEDMPTDEKWVFCKELEFIHPSISLSFLAHCEIIKEKANPVYGFIFDGSYYNEKGIYFSKTGAKNYTTCVGFCINVLTGFGFKIEKYLEFDDWDASSTNGFRNMHPNCELYFRNFMKALEVEHPEEFEEYCENYIKRITPIEFTTSGFFNEHPVRKKDIDKAIPDIDQVIKNKISA